MIKSTIAAIAVIVLNLSAQAATVSVTNNIPVISTQQVQQVTTTTVTPVLPPGAPSLVTNTQSLAQLLYNEATSGGTNYTAVTYGTYSPSLVKADRFGGGLALLWPLYQNGLELWVGPRAEWFNGGFYTLSGNATMTASLQPFTWWPSIVVEPFIYAGIGEKWGQSASTFAMTGEGGAVGWKISTHLKFDLVADREQRTGFGYSYCVGPALNFTW